MTNSTTGRIRDLSRYAPRPQSSHASLEEFLDSKAPLEEGIHSISIGSATADFLYEERGGPLLVVFPAALGKTVTWPFFTGLGVAQDVSASLLALSDPSVELPGVGTGWSLGDHRVPFHTILPGIIRKFAPSRRLIFFGMSAGGYSALHYVSKFENAVAVVGNPRTHLFTPPTALQYRAPALYGTEDPREIASMVPVGIRPTGNRIIYLQNSGDFVYFSSHMIPYLQKIDGDADVWTIIDYWGEGHVAPPGDLVRSVLAAVLADPLDSAGAVRFRSVEEVRAHQAALNIRRMALR